MNWQEYLAKAIQQPLFKDLPEIPEYRAKGKRVELRWYSDPRTDNQRLMSLQYEYRNEGNQEALVGMYEILKTIAAKYINTIAEKNKRVKNMSVFDKESKAANAATYMVEQMILRPDFVITTSFTGYLYLRVEFELYYHRKVDGIVDFVDIAQFFKEGTEPEAIEKDLVEKWEETQAMKRYIAIGDDGENKVFENQDELLSHFVIQPDRLYEIIGKGKPVAEPGTLKIFYIDELETTEEEA